MEVEMNGLGDTNQANVLGIFEHAILTEADRYCLTAMESNINQSPNLLKETAGMEACCIFKVPQSLVGINENAYRPDMVSIGPYYHDHKHLKMIQEHKWRFLNNILARTRALPVSVGVDDLYIAIKLEEEEIRKCYSQTIPLSCQQLVEMMVLDGCFLIELFLKVHKQQCGNGDDDPILKMSWVLTLIARDLLKLENQIPFFVLEKLFQKTILALGQENDHLSMKNLILEFFSYTVTGPTEPVLRRQENLSSKHILDLFRLSIIPRPSTSPQRREGLVNEANVNQIPTALKLRLAGVKFMPLPRDRSDSFLHIKLKNGVLQIPNLMFDDFTTSFLLNCVAFEQCYSYCSNEVTSYATFMGCLIKSPEDAEYLCGRKIIENYVGAPKQVACFFNNLGKDLPTDIHESYLKQLFEDVNKYCSEGLHVCWAGFVNTYFRSRWSIITVIVGFLMLVSTLLQAFFALFPYVNSSHQKSRKMRLF